MNWCLDAFLFFLGVDVTLAGTGSSRSKCCCLESQKKERVWRMISGVGRVFGISSLGSAACRFVVGAFLLFLEKLEGFLA